MCTRANAHTCKRAHVQTRKRKRTVRSVFAFVGLDPAHVLEDAAPKNVRGEYTAAMAPPTEAQLRRFYAPFNAKLYELLGRDLGWDGGGGGGG